MKKILLFFSLFIFAVRFCFSQPGQPNPSFGIKGVITSAASGHNGLFVGLAIQKEKIITIDAGSSGYLQRYKENGDHDSSFGTNGNQYLNAGYADGAAAIAVQDDGKILVLSRNTLARFNAGGEPDNTFGQNGYRLIDSTSKYVNIRAIAIQEDAKIVAAGTTYSGGVYGFGIYRFNVNGSTDVTFSGDGKQKTNFSSYAEVSSLAIQADGRIVAGGLTRIARYNYDGSLDNTFGTGGKLEIAFDLTRIALQHDGKIIAVGASGVYPNVVDFAIARINANGNPDITFNGNGRQSTTFKEGHGQDVSVAVQSDNKILVAGTVYHKEKRVIAITRFNADGSVDSSFGHSGIQETAGLGGQDYFCTDIVVLNNKAYAGGGFSPVIVSYLLGESNATQVQFTQPFYSQGFYTGPANIPLSAEVTNRVAGSTTKKVQFYNNTTLLYTATAAPYAFTWKNVSIGRYDITAKATDNNGKEITSSTVALEVVPNQPPRIELVNPFYYGDTPVYYPVRLLAPATVNFSASAYDPDPDGTISRVEFYDAAKLIYTDSTLPYSFTWKNIPFGNHAVTAKAIDNSKLTTTTIYPARFSVDSSIQPSVSITAPFNNQNYNGPLATVNIIAEAHAMYPGGAIGKVEFYNGTTLLNTDSTYPYNFTWTGVPPGTFIITTRATNTHGVSAVSSPVRIFVVVDQSPLVKLTAPGRDTNIIAASSILLAAEATGTYSLIKSVAFYNDSVLLFTENKAPFSRVWNFTRTGSYHIKAVATDLNGLTATSATIHVTVLHNRPPVVNITSPANGSTYPAPASIVLTANAVAHGVKIRTVKFYKGTILIHTEENAPYEWTWYNVPAGTYSITAIVTDAYDRSTTSSPVTVTVTPTGFLALSSPPITYDKAAIGRAEELQLSPNPARSTLNLYTKEWKRNRNVSISVISSSGVIMQTIKTAGMAKIIPFNISSLPVGMYVLKIVSGDEVVYRQFVKVK